MTTFQTLAPFLVLLLASIGFILNLIADHFHVQQRVKIGFILFLLACISVMVMK